MAITTNDVCARVRARLKRLVPVEDIPRVDFLIMNHVPPALEDLARKVAYDANKRHLLLTAPSTTTAALNASGVADLSALIANPRVLLDCLKYGTIYPPAGSPSTQPFRVLEHAGQGRLRGVYDALVYKCWVEGSQLHTKSANNNVTPLAGNISFAVPRIPGLPDVPFALEGTLTDLIVDRVDAEREKDAN